MLYNIFGVQVHSIDIKSFDKVENKLIQYCYQEKKKDPVGVHFSNRGGWQSKSHGFRESLLCSLIHQSIGDYFQENNIFKEGIRIEMANMWININKKGDYNILHDHPRCDMSGVLWIKIPEESGNLVMEHNSSFAAEHMLNCYSEEMRKTFSAYQNWVFSPQSGKIVLFPSYIRHCVGENESRHDRISVSFNMHVHTS